MFDIGWQELLLIGVVALVVIGPKDMPVAMRTAARMFSKVRGLSREFQNTVSEVVREAELDELRRKVQQAGKVNVKDELTDLVDPTGRLRKDLQDGDEFEDLDDDLHRSPAPPRTASGGGASAGAAPAPATPASTAPAAPVPPPASPSSPLPTAVPSPSTAAGGERPE